MSLDPILEAREQIAHAIMCLEAIPAVLHDVVYIKEFREAALGNLRKLQFVLGVSLEWFG